MSARNFSLPVATGKQGGAVIRALLSRSSPFSHTRPDARRILCESQSLALNPQGHCSLRVITRRPRPSFQTHGPIHGVFLVTTPGDEEESQATRIIVEAAKSDVKHLVFSSVDRGGAAKSEVNPTNIPHFASKHRIERFLQQKYSESKMKWTILRPVAFMDNLTANFSGKVFASIWASLKDKPLQLISVHDIGVFVARSFEDPDAYKSRAISLAGDDLTLAQGKKAFKESLGYEMPETFGLVGTAIKYMVKEVGTLSAWFKNEGYGADISALRKEEPTLQNFGTWLKESSQFKKK